MLIQEGFPCVFQGVIVPHIVGFAAVAYDDLKTFSIIGINLKFRGLVRHGLTA